MTIITQIKVINNNYVHKSMDQNSKQQCLEEIEFELKAVVHVQE